MSINLSPLQFADREEPLPGMEKRSPFAQTAAWQDEKENMEYRAERDIRDARSQATGPLTDRWSGPDPHQLVMGVHDLAQNNGQMDRHGFVTERSFMNRSEHDPEHPGVVQSPDENNLGSGGNGIPAKNFYARYGGRKANDPNVAMHWASQPLVQVRSDALVHTHQSTDETELGRAHNNPEYQKEFPNHNEGRERVNNIRDDVEQGNPIRNAAWLVKHNNRLFSLDGHHRILAAREGGLPTFPARVWDLDAERRPKRAPGTVTLTKD